MSHKIVPDYRSASARRSAGKADALDYFVSEWEPSMRTHDDTQIAKWHRDLEELVYEEFIAAMMFAQARRSEEHLNKREAILLIAMFVIVVVFSLRFFFN